MLLEVYLAKKFKIFSVVLYTKKLEKLTGRYKYGKAITNKSDSADLSAYER
jgi:hypothetical protein